MNNRNIFREIIFAALIGIFSCSFFTCSNGGDSSCSHEFYNGTVTAAATCIAKGVLTKTCIKCPETTKEEIAIDTVNGHKWEHKGVVVKQETCITDGIGKAECILCEETEDNHVFPKTGEHTHVPATGVCPIVGCGALTYEIGNEGPGGGIIYYVADGKSDRSFGFTVQMINIDDNYTAYYLEAAPSNANSDVNTAWCACTSDAGCRNSGVSGMTNVTSVTDTTVSGYIAHGAIGTGRKNTALILAAHSTAVATSNAAKACDVMTGGKSDWFLPSVEELNHLYINRIYVGNMGTNTYWSSSQSGNIGVWSQSFANGGQGELGKLTGLRVRAIRAF